MQIRKSVSLNSGIDEFVKERAEIEGRSYSNAIEFMIKNYKMLVAKVK